MKKSFVLLSALVVTTTFIVNCQKAPDKRRVRPTSGSGTQSDIADQKAKLPTKVCSAELIASYKDFSKNSEAVKKTVINTSTPDAEKEAFAKLSVRTLAKCTELIDQLKLEDNQGCYLDNGVKDSSNALMASGVDKLCRDLGVKADKEGGVDNSFANAQKEIDKIKSDIIGKTLKMSKEVRVLVAEGNTNGGKFLADGELGSSYSSMKAAVAASKTVCTFTGNGLTIDEAKETTLKITAIKVAQKSDLTDLDADFTGQAALLKTEIKQEQEDAPSIIDMLCLNLDVTKITYEGLTKALGTGITSAPVQVATEVTGAASEAAKPAPAAVSATAFTAQDLAAKQPAGSPQAQNLASGTAQMIADANKVTPQKEADQKAASDKAAAEKKAKEEKAAADKLAEEKAEKEEAAKVSVVTTPVASSGASATVAAKEQAEDAAGQLAMLKEKAERLEAEAVAAEADVKKLEEVKAKAEDVDQAKAKARITRESADSAKAEYAEAQKAAPAVAAK